ncbi:hypothetical protein [Cupriavidus necator]|uniref:hypothetical protein n=1 Tax=Cupriavidus necator TaxID=106590 RepID=UPI0005B471BE|nr:hypothetical protein [Cupriavidus necator]
MKHALRILAGIAVLGAVPVLTACYPYPYPAEVVPTTYPGPQPSRYDRAFAAAAGAMRDQGVSISTEDFSSGTVAGTRNNRPVTASVRRQADGTVRVQFDGGDPGDPGLLERISRSYDARMGR